MWQLFVRRHNFFPALYLENNSIELNQILYVHWYWHDPSWDISCPVLQICTRIWFHRILYMHLYWQDLAWDCFTSFFPNLYQSYGPLFKPKVCFCSIFWEQMDRISPNFKYALILTTSILGSVHVIFWYFLPVLWHLIYAKILFLLNILRTNWQNFIKF